MTNYKTKRTIISLSLAIFLTGTSFSTLTNKCQAKEQVGADITSASTQTKQVQKNAATQSKQVTAKKDDSKKISVKVTKGQSEQAAVCINNSEVIKYTQAAGGYSPEVRAKILANRLQKFIKEGGNPKDILPGIENKIPVARINGAVLFTADASTAQELNISRNELAIKWINNIREALGAPKITRDFARIASRSGVSVEFARRSANIQQQGLASWYGGQFHGRTTANGSKFSKYEFTAAHKTLPMGTYVKVTNLDNNKSCIVQITDRGPFVPGRIIDLSKSAANHLEMLSSGISKVTIQVIDSF